MKDKIVKLPDLKILESPSGLLDFYIALGYDRESDKVVKPMNVLLSTKDQLKALQSFQEGFRNEEGILTDDDKLGASLLFMNNGPSGDEGVEDGTVKLVGEWLVKE